MASLCYCIVKYHEAVEEFIVDSSPCAGVVAGTLMLQI